MFFNYYQHCYAVQENILWTYFTKGKKHDQYLAVEGKIVKAKDSGLETRIQDFACTILFGMKMFLTMLKNWLLGTLSQLRWFPDFRLHWK